MGDRLSLCFFVNENHTFIKNRAMMWIEDEAGKDILGDNYDYYLEYKINKKEIKESLKIELPNQKGLYKELVILINKMKEYEE